eukprot:1465930-Rhodomonas_salina.3
MIPLLTSRKVLRKTALPPFLSFIDLLYADMTPPFVRFAPCYSVVSKTASQPGDDEEGSRGRGERHEGGRSDGGGTGGTLQKRGRSPLAVAAVHGQRAMGLLIEARRRQSDGE